VHHGLPSLGALSSEDRREWLDRLDVPFASRQVISVALSSIDRINEEMGPIDAQLKRIARRQPGARALSLSWDEAMYMIS
jgi:hypothetical protein